MSEFIEQSVLFNTDPNFTSAIAMPLMRDGFFDVVKQLDGGRPTQKVTIQDGIISPKSADVIVDTEGEAPADDLEIIDIQNTNDGMHLRLWCADTSRAVKIKHNTESLYGIRLSGNQDKMLSTESYIEIKRDGDYWNEIVSNSTGTPAAEIPSTENPSGVAGVVTPDGDTITIDENGFLKSSGGLGLIPTTLIWSPTGTIFPGTIDVSIISEPLPRDAFPGVIDILSRPENNGVWVDESVWQDEIATIGFTAKFSRGDGVTTWRPPYYNECFFGAAGLDRTLGTAKLDQTQGWSWGRHDLPNHDATYIAKGFIGASASTGGNYDSFWVTSAGADASDARLVRPDYFTDGSSGEPRIGNRTEPRAVYGKVLMCVGTTVIQPSDIDMAKLLDMAAHKLDISTYEVFKNNFLFPNINSEVKTAYQFKGKDVYCAYLDCGMAPNNTYKEVPFPEISIDDFVYGNYIMLDTRSSAVTYWQTDNYAMAIMGARRNGILCVGMRPTVDFTLIHVFYIAYYTKP